MNRATALQSEIRSWLESGKNRTRKVLSDSSGVNYGSIRNACDGKEVNDDTALRIAMSIMTPAKVHSFALSYIPKLTNFTKSLVEFGTQVVSPIPFSRKHCEALIALTFESLSKSELKFKIGSSAETVLSDLVAAEYVKETDGKVVLSNYELFFTAQAMLAEYGKIILDNVQMDCPGNLLYGRMASVDDATYREIFSILTDAEQKIGMLVRDRTRQGNNKVGYNVAMTTF